MTDTAALKAQLETIPPNSTVELSWQTPDGTAQTKGQLVSYDPHSAARRIETTESTLLLVPSEDGREISVAELTLTKIVKITVSCDQIIDVICSCKRNDE